MGVKLCTIRAGRKRFLRGFPAKFRRGASRQGVRRIRTPPEHSFICCLRQLLLGEDLGVRAKRTSYLGAGFLALGVVAAAIAKCWAAAPPVPPLALVEVAIGVWVHFGQVSLTTPENQGDVANLGIIVGK